MTRSIASFMVIYFSNSRSICVHHYTSFIQMASPGNIQSDEPLTPASKLFLEPETSQIINFAIGVLLPLDLVAIRNEIKDSLMLQHFRFSSLLVRDRHGVPCWRRTQVDIDRHLVVVGEDPGDDRFSEAQSKAAVSDYQADLAVSTPLSPDKPLWECHVLMAHRCVIFRVHHALGDGLSLLSLLLAGCRRADDPGALPSLVSLKSTGASAASGRRRFWGAGLAWRLVKAMWFTVVFMVEFVARCLWVSDRTTPISGGDGVELWPRKIATASFWLQDMKVVKRAVPGATINDVLFGIISYGLSKYLYHRSPDATEEGLQLTGLAMVNLRVQSELQDLSEMIRQSNASTKLGNKFGAVLLPVQYQKHGDPLEHLRRAKTMLDRKKHSLEAFLSHKIADLITSCFGPKYASLLNYRLVCNTSFSISNVAGPQEDIVMIGNPVKYMRSTATCLAHAITMHMFSYAGKAEMSVLVAKDIIPDPEVLAKCFEDALLEMKEAAIDITKMM